MAWRNVLARLLPYGKYLGLAVALYIWLAIDQPRANVPLRVGDFFGSVALTFGHANLFWLVAHLLRAGTGGSGGGVANAWCRFACPTGETLEAFKGLAIFRVYKTEACNDCPQEVIKLGRKGVGR